MAVEELLKGWWVLLPDAIDGVPRTGREAFRMGFWVGIVSDSETIPAQIQILPRSAGTPSFASGDAGTPHFQSDAAVEIVNLGRVTHETPTDDPTDSGRFNLPRH